MKKIIFVSNIGWTLYNFRLGTMRRLREEGFDVFFSSGYDRCAQELIKEGFAYIPIRVDRKGLNILQDISLFLSLWRIYAKHRFDLALHYSIKPNIYGAIAAGLARVKCINTVAGLGHVFSRKGWLWVLIKVLYRIAFRFPETVFFQNKADRDLFLSEGLVEQEKVVLVPGSGVDAARFSPEIFKKEQQGDFVFLFSGRILWEKGAGETVSAFRRVREKYPRSVLRILGFIDKGNPSGVPEEMVQRWQQEGVVEYLGAVLDVRPVLAQCDVVVYPSYYREGIPRTLLEAMAMGKPVITADSVGCRDVVTDGVDGLLVPPRDTGALTAAMEKMILLSSEKRFEMGRKGREKILRDFDEKTVIVSYLEAVLRSFGSCSCAGQSPRGE